MAGDEPEGKKQKLDHSPNYGHELGVGMVDIFVGASKQHFQIHKKLLCTKVEYFKKMFESAFKEGVEQAATLPKDDPNTFALFVEWLYGDCLQPIDISTHDPPEHDAFLDRIGLYGFAEKICLPDLMDYVITTIISSYKHHGRHPTIEAVVLSYQLSAPESPIRSLMSGNFNTIW